MSRLRYPLLTLFLLLAIPALSQDVVDDPSYTLNTGDHVQVTRPSLRVPPVRED